MDNRDLFSEVVSYENLELAFQKARKGKTLKDYVIKFEEMLEDNLLILRNELIFHTYKPKPLETFILRDPKTRKISKSDFRDRVVHHAIVNIMEDIFDKSFIHDSYANRKGKGTLKAIERFDFFKRKVSRNNTRRCFILKADIRHYFENISHNIFLSVIKKKINNLRLLWLIKVILANHNVGGDGSIGMPLGNLTSQFFANVYLNELDKYVKRKLRVKYYIRYVDDFVIFHNSLKMLKSYKYEINNFLKEKLKLELHPDKSRILILNEGINFLGFRVFYNHKLVRKKNLRKFERKFTENKALYKNGKIEREKALDMFEGWTAYTLHANTYKYRMIMTRRFDQYFPADNSKIKNLKKEDNFANKIEVSHREFTTQKTLQLLKRGLTIKQIVEQRRIKESTVWGHMAKLIEYGQLNVWKILEKEKILAILPNIYNINDKLKDIKERIKDNAINYDEINCVFAGVKYENKKKGIVRHINWYKRNHCFRKCFRNPEQRIKCSKKFDVFIKNNPKLEMSKNEFLDLFNNNMYICVLPEEEKLRYISWEEFTQKHKFSKSILETINHED